MALLKEKKNNLFLILSLIAKIQRRGNKKKIEKKILLLFRNLKQEQVNNIKIASFLNNVIEKTKPYVGVRLKKVGSVTQSIPINLSLDKEISVGLHWIISESCKRKMGSFSNSLQSEFMAISLGKGKSLQRKEALYKLVIKNRAFIKLLFRY